MSNRKEKPQRRMIYAACSEVLERRRLLTFEFFGTAGNDTIQVSYDTAGDEYHFTLNGSPAGSTLDSDVFIWASQGDDTVMLYHVADGTRVRVRGGSGFDRVEVGNGFLPGNLQGQVLLDRGSGGQVEELIASDSSLAEDVELLRRMLQS